MTLRELNEMFTSANLSAGLDWDETPSDVKDSHNGLSSKLPISIPDEFKEDGDEPKKKKRKKRAKRK